MYFIYKILNGIIKAFYLKFTFKEFILTNSSIEEIKYLIPS